jgi:hypothetical protein
MTGRPESQSSQAAEPSREFRELEQAEREDGFQKLYNHSVACTMSGRDVPSIYFNVFFA